MTAPSAQPSSQREAQIVQRYIKEALRPMLFADDDLDHKATRDPVAPAERSRSANNEAVTKQLEEESPRRALARFSIT